MLQHNDNENQIYSPQGFEKGTRLEEDGRIYVVESCREFLEELGEPKGYLLTIKEVLQ